MLNITGLGWYTMQLTDHLPFFPGEETRAETGGGNKLTEMMVLGVSPGLPATQ